MRATIRSCVRTAVHDVEMYSVGNKHVFVCCEGLYDQMFSCANNIAELECV